MAIPAANPNYLLNLLPGDASDPAMTFPVLQAWLAQIANNGGGSGGGNSTIIGPLGTQSAANSVSVALATGSTIVTTQGATPWSDNLTQVGGSTLALGQTSAAASIPVTLANEDVQDLYITGAAAQTTLNNNIMLAVAGSGSIDTQIGTPAISYRSIVIGITTSAGVAAGAVTLEGSMDNTNFVAMQLVSSFSSSPALTTLITLAASTTVVFKGSIDYRYIRARISTGVTGGTVQAFTRLSTVSYGNNFVSVPLPAGGRAFVTLPSSAPNANNGGNYLPITSTNQLAVHLNGDPANEWNASSGTTPLATTTSTALKAAGAAGVRNYVTGLQCYNTSATVSTTVSILDGASVIWTGFLPATTAALPIVDLVADFLTPLKGTAATAINIQLGTTSASVYYNVQGYQNN